jgi:hypothetical protein
MNRTLLAIVACLAIFIAYACIGAALGWKHGGGMIPTLILLAALSATWKGIRSGGSAAADSNQVDNKPPAPKQDE